MTIDQLKARQRRQQIDAQLDYRSTENRQADRLAIWFLVMLGSLAVLSVVMIKFGTLAKMLEVLR